MRVVFVLYLSGAKNPHIAPVLRSGVVGLLQTPATRYTLDGVAVWAMDNGCFTGTYPGDDGFMGVLAAYEAHRDRCLFVAAPDVVGDGAATLRLLPAMAGRIRAAGWPVAVVGQDGMEHLPVPWHMVDWLFVGGSTEWKLGAGARALIEQARAHGKRVHMGRVNSLRRLRYADYVGCDTADGTYVAFGPELNTGRLLNWVGVLDQPVLF